MDAMGLGGHDRRRVVAAAAALAVPAVLAGSAASADQVPTVAPLLAAYSPVSPGTSCVPKDVAGVVNAIAWAEIERLGEAGLPVCDVEWRFVADRDEWWWWGFADADVAPGEVPDVWIVQDVAAYADEGAAEVDGGQLEQHVRTTVRHELGHALGALLDLNDENLADLVVVELEQEGPETTPVREAFAEAIALALTPADENRTVFYDEDVPEENVRAAELVLRAFVTD
ncbi:hypothetical protein [Cellulosimicrobium sp. JZ28]|uniref:hypothetical protein n=1 Tax=Cellulosimicrobium sp. JZ28 TaxID=1906273 RepID=UPI00188D18EF|nr:hypothetical protein [Cellulosimicrobium sp. JZ28]